MKKELTIVTIVTIEFIAFSCMGAFLYLQADNHSDTIVTISTVLLILTLLCCVLLTIVRSFTIMTKKIDSLVKLTSSQESEADKIQVQFEHAIEERTYQLQTVNGALNREIAERTQAEEEIRELQKQFELILDCAGEGILGLDNHGKVIFMNQAASLMLGWSRDELLGNTHHDIIHHTHANGTPHPEEDCPIYMAYRDGIVHYKTGDIFWCKNGSSFSVEYVSTPIKDKGLLTGAVVVFRDLNTYK